MDEKGISNNLDMQLDRVYRNTLLQVHDLESPDGFFRGNCANLTEEELDQLGFHTPQIQEIQLGREAGVDVSEYAKDFYNWKQMREIRRGLEQRVDVRLYKNPLFSSGQMRQIRMGLNDGLDVSVYADLMYSVTDMKSIRESLLSEIYTDNDKGYGKKTIDEATGIIMHISDDYLTAYVTLPRKKEEITMADVMVALTRNGIRGDLIEPNVPRIGTEESFQRPIPIMEGKRVVRGKDGYFDFFFDLPNKKPLQLQKDGTLDITPFFRVKKAEVGQVLVMYHYAEHGTEGCTVTGVPIRGASGRDLPELQLDGSVSYNYLNGKYEAEIEGIPRYSAVTDTLWISQIHEIMGNVRKDAGEVHVEGDVHVLGTVEPGAKISATGSIYIEGQVINGILDAGQDIVVRGDVEGKQSRLWAKGNVYAMGYLGAQIEANGDVKGNFFQDCIIHSYGAVEGIGSNSRILGGRIFAAKSIAIDNVRKNGDKNATVSVGDQLWIEEVCLKYETELEQMNSLVEQLESARKSVESVLPSQALEGNDAYKKTMQSLEERKAQKRELEQKLQMMERIKKNLGDGFIRVDGKIEGMMMISVGGVRTPLPSTMGPYTFTQKQVQSIQMSIIKEARDKKS